MMDGVKTPFEEKPVAYTLPGALAPFPDESLIGLVVRTAEAHRFHDPMRLFRRVKRAESYALWTFCQQDSGSWEGQAVRELLGLDQSTFDRMSMWTGVDNMLAVQGWPVWNELVRHTARVVCPLCLQDELYHRSAWLVDVLPVCPVHGVWLRDVCHNPDCGRPLSWSGTGIHRCGNRRCRYDLRQASLEHCAPDMMGGLTSLTRILNSTDASAAPLGMPPGEAIRMAFVLGKMSCGLEQTARAPGFIRRELQRMPAIMDAGWNALDDWPNGFHALLERQRTRAADRAGKGGLRKAFGMLSKLVYDWAREPWGAPIGVAFADYASGCTDLATTSHTLSRYAPGAELRHLHLSLSEAQRLLEVSPMVMQAIAERRGMYVLPPQGKGTRALLRADHVRQLHGELTDFILPEQARAIVGVGRKAFDQLETDGLVRRVPEDECLIPSRPYRRSEVEGFVKACVGKPPQTTRIAAKSDGLTALTRASGLGRSVADMCRALMSGKLRSVATATDAHGLMKIRLRMSDLERKLSLSRETLSIVETARLLGMSYGFLHIWARQGFLDTHASPRASERGLRVSWDAYERFHRDYVHAGELPAIFKQPQNKWLSRHLVFVGVKPVSGPGVDDCRLTLFRRDDITAKVIHAVCQVQAGLPGTAQDKHRQAFARGLVAANIVATRWNAQFERTNNRFTDLATGRVLQVIAGRRPDLTGVFRFMINTNSLVRLQALPSVWVALVPFVGDTFILAPLHEMAWRGLSLNGAYVTLRFDKAGVPLDMRDWAVALH